MAVLSVRDFAWTVVLLAVSVGTGVLVNVLLPPNVLTTSGFSLKVTTVVVVVAVLLLFLGRVLLTKYIKARAQHSVFSSGRYR